jgi:transposase
MLANGITEVGCMAHACRKFFELHVANKSQIAEQKAKPIADTLFKWMQLQRQKVTDGSATAKALDYTLKRWPVLTRYIDDGQLPIDNNWIENQIRPIAIGRSNWLFAGSLRAGQRAAAVMSLIQSAKMNGHDPYAYLKDVLTRLPTHKASQVEDLLPHLWQAPSLDT